MKGTQEQQTIELDCAPGFPRPGDLIDGVIGGTGLPSREPVSKFFGNWIWDYSDIDPKEWKRVNPTVKERVTKLYHSGVIRYGSW
jgi:hypothetical protein